MTSAGHELAAYRVERLLGRGSSAAVYLAQDLRDLGWVALKVFEPGSLGVPADDAERRRRFADEVQVVQRLSHADIVAVLAWGEADGRPWLAMELASGCPLSRYTHPQRLLPLPLVVDTGRRLALALQHAHALGVVHRDVKPANVLVDVAAQRLKLGDFGTARLLDKYRTRTELMLGTPVYMAPEVLAGQPATPAADLYALGVTLFELLSGRRPHEAASLGELLQRVAGEPAPDLGLVCSGLPPPLTQLVARLLDRRPQNRPASGAELAQELRGLAPPPTAAAAPSAGVDTLQHGARTDAQSPSC